MKKIFLLIPVLILTGCFHAVPVKRTFPEVPKELIESCPDLKLIEEKTTKLSGVISVVSENYGKYHECKVKLDSFIQWYNLQKENFKSVK